MDYVEYMQIYFKDNYFGGEMKIIFRLALLSLLFIPVSIFAADDEVEEVVVTGSQIKGAKITGPYLFQSFQTQTLKRLELILVMT